MKKKGLTLIELLIVMVLMSILMPVIVSIYISGIKTFNQELTQTQLQSNAQTILDEIMNDTKNAQAVLETYNGETTNTSTIILRIPAIDASQVIQYNGTDMLFDVIIYKFEGNNIHKIVYSPIESNSVRRAQDGRDKVIASNILNLIFDYDPDPVSPTLVTTTVTNNQAVGIFVRKVTVTSKARLRNHI